MFKRFLISSSIISALLLSQSPIYADINSATTEQQDATLSSVTDSAIQGNATPIDQENSSVSNNQTDNTIQNNASPDKTEQPTSTTTAEVPTSEAATSSSNTSNNDAISSETQKVEDTLITEKIAVVPEANHSSSTINLTKRR